MDLGNSVYDFCICGAGMVGAALALGLVKQGYRVALIETQEPVAFATSQPPDLRMSAISAASVELLTQLGAWQFMQAQRLRPYSKLSVWEGNDARTDFDADAIGVERLGYFVENRLLQLSLHQALAEYANLTWLMPAKIASIDLHDSRCANIELVDGRRLECLWLIGADGANSRVRQAADIATSGWQYQQQAMGITVELHAPVDDWTWQVFHPTGPRAFLPMHDNFGCLIWYDSATTIAELSQLSKDALKQRIVSAFPAELVDFSVLDHARFSLTRSHATRYVQGNVILVGDAAHTINPLAGQGVNLGFKDVRQLLNVTDTQPELSAEAFTHALVKQYEAKRRRDNLMMMSAMDVFYLLFSHTNTPVSLLRKGMLKLAQHAGPAKHAALKYAMGMN